MFEQYILYTQVYLLNVHRAVLLYQYDIRTGGAIAMSKRRKKNLAFVYMMPLVDKTKLVFRKCFTWYGEST